MELFMNEVVELLPYLIVFIVLILILNIVFFTISKKQITSKNVGIYGLLMNFTDIDILKISLIIVCYLSILESIIIVNNSYYNINFILIPILLFEILNKSFYKIPIDILELAFIYFILIFKNVFYSYLTNVNVLWYVILLYIILCIFIFVFATYILFENINILMNKKLESSKHQLKTSL